MRNTYVQQCDYKSRFRILKKGRIALVISALCTSTTLSFATPTGGVVTSGNAAITQSGMVTNINQSTQKASINWSTFSIGSTETVNFNQPNTSSITLNRVIGNEKSVIDGALNANGQVWILNSNGVLFGKNASINTSGLIATTKSLSDADFQAGNYTLSGDSKASVINLGTVEIANGGYAALLANTVSNEGTIRALKGKIELVGGDSFSINLNGNSLVNLTVTKGVLDALVENKGALIAEGGEIYLTTNAVNDLLKGVVNNTGLIEAQTLDDVAGKIELYAHGGEVKVGGAITTGAEEGFVETSGKTFSIDPSASIITGEWLLDPVSISIDSTLASAIMSALGSGSVTISTDGGNTPSTSSGESGSAGDINVNSAISWSTNKTLTLLAFNDININANLTHTGTSAGGMIFLYGQGTSDGGTSKYSVNNSATVTSPSLQWRKGSDHASARYAIVDGSVFLGGKYIEIGIHSTKGVFGSTNGTATPSLFFGRQGGNTRIGMIGDADGFGVGQDLRIDYFLPGSDYENYRVFFNGNSTSGYNNEFDSVHVNLLGLGANNTLQAQVISAEGDMQVVQNITFKADSKYFQNSVVLKNNGATAMTGVAFAREFDPDNNRDVGGSSQTIQTIEATISSDGYAALSGKSQANDPYEALAGSQSNILFYSADNRAELAVGSGCCNNVTTYGDPLFTKGYSVLGDKAMAIKFNVGSLAAGASSSEIIYQTSLDNRDIGSILNELNSNSIKKPILNTPPSVIAAIVNNTAVEQPHNIQTFTSQQITSHTQQTNYVHEGEKITLASTTDDENANELVSLSEIRQMKRTNSATSGTENSSDTTQQNNSGESTGIDTSIRIPLSRGSLIDIVDGGVKLPENVEQEFYVLNQTR